MRKNSISFIAKKIIKGTHKQAKRGLYSISIKDKWDGLSVAKSSLNLKRLKIIDVIAQYESVTNFV